jgi:carboxyl-terminal processing protease
LDRAFRLDNCPTAAVKLTTSFYYTPSGKSIQAKGIVPQLMVDETKEGNLFAALRTREADLDNHLGNTQVAETKDPAQVKAREEALQKLDEELRKPPSERKAAEYGSAEDFQLTQALNQLKGLPVLLSKTQVERKEEKKEP